MIKLTVITWICDIKELLLILLLQSNIFLCCLTVYMYRYITCVCFILFVFTIYELVWNVQSLKQTNKNKNKWYSLHAGGEDVAHTHPLLDPTMRTLVIPPRVILHVSARNMVQPVSEHVAFSHLAVFHTSKNMKMFSRIHYFLTEIFQQQLYCTDCKLFSDYENLNDIVSLI